MAGRTLFEKIWDAHTIVRRDDGQVLLYVDRHLVHDLHYRRFDKLERDGRPMRRPDLTFATPDHSMPTTVTRVEEIEDDEMRETVAGLERNATRHNVTLFPLSDDRHGIVHVVGPEQGLTLPGILLVCGDSHTSTHGALGCISFGIGSSEVEHVLATQTIWQRTPKTMRINVEGTLGSSVYGKDIILALIRRISAAGGTGYAIEFAGSAIRGLSMDGRMTVCNMTIEAGGRTGMVAPDETTFDYVKDRPYAPSGAAWTAALEAWRGLPSDPDAVFDKEVTVDADDLAPMVTWGNSPENAIQINEQIPDPAHEEDPEKRASMEAALEYMGLMPGMSLSDVAVDKVFIGACTNSRLDDLRAAAAVAKGRKAQVPTLVVPGSGLIKKAAEAEGLDQIFVEAGMEWREPGCSMCVAMNGDTLDAGKRSASTSNRNFRGRQGLGSRTHLVSPAMAAAASVSGRFVDVRELVQ